MNSPSIASALDYLRDRDPVLREVIDRVGDFTLDPDPDVFKSLVRAIVGQQISTSAARSIYNRLISAVGGEERLRNGLGTLSAEDYRSAGISPQKARYLLDLATKVGEGTVQLENLSERSNEEIIAELTEINGVGVWTVQMLLIFSLGRLDVFPGGDLGIRMAIQRLYRKRSLPKTPAQLRKFEKLWQPYASIASWYCWRSLEFPKLNGVPKKAAVRVGARTRRERKR